MIKCNGCRNFFADAERCKLFSEEVRQMDNPVENCKGKFYEVRDNVKLNQINDKLDKIILMLKQIPSVHL